MADVENLRTASLYINNQLLSRGLLRDGETIDFSDPGRSEGGTAGAMGRIMSIVNDLILRRDRDAEHRESLSVTLRTVRAENLRQTNDLTRLTEKHTEIERKLNISESAEATLRTQLKSAEAAVRGLKDEMARAKSLVAQTRSSCATEVRRRDRQIDGLKKQLGEATRSRGSVRNPAISVITVTGNMGLERGSPSHAGSMQHDGYDLRSETNEFLTELAKSLSEENETILGLLQRLRDALKTMSGWEREAAEGDGHAISVAANVSEIESDLDGILDHLRNILTNPSFVPLEEVEMRDEEIGRLRDGWTQMETRWKEAVHLIDGWRRRMASSGRPVNEEELKMSLRLSPVRVRDVAETQGMNLRLSCVPEEDEEEEEEEAALEEEEDQEEEQRYHPQQPSSPCPQGFSEPLEFDAPSAEDGLHESDSEASVYDEGFDMEELNAEEPNMEEILEQSDIVMPPTLPALDSSPLPEPPQLSPLKYSDSAGNRGTANEPKSRQRPSEQSIIADDDTCELIGSASRALPTRERREAAPRRQARPPVVTRSSRVQKARLQRVDMDCSTSSLDSILLDSPSKEPLQPRPRQKPKQFTPAKTAEPSTTSSSKRAEHAIAQKETRSSSAPDRASPAVHTTTASITMPVQASAKRILSRLPLARPNDPPPQQSPLTMTAIAAKLAASEREADAARVRAKLKAARLARRKPDMEPPAVPGPSAPDEPAEEDVDSLEAVEAQPEPEQDNLGLERAEAEVPVKKKREKRANKVASRRRSTLSPWELESLISGKVAATQVE